MGFLLAAGARRYAVAAALLCAILPCHAKLSTRFYARTCPNVEAIVRSVMAPAVAREPRMGASITRLFFHDCFVNGCDASILLDDTPTFTGEKNAGANVNSVRGYEVIDAIKARVEAACKATVSCADIVALAARDAVNLLRGPTWSVPLGRKDARTATQSAANANLPGPGSSAASLVSAFAAKGLSAREMTALSGAHTVGRARCLLFRGRIYGEANINATFAAARRQTCPQAGGDGNLAPFDDRTPDAFDNAYYTNLVARRGLLHSDQELFNGGPQDALVRKYSGNGKIFAGDFAKAMVKMGGLMPAAGTPTEGCDASILLDDTASFTGEKNAGPNANSVRGYEVIDAIKAQVEASCSGIVSCTDIVALAARDSVNLLGGPTWTVQLGRRDARNTSQSAANSNLPGPGSSLATLITMFGHKGLSPRDMTALSGAHTVGQARCTTFRDRIYNDANINASFAALRQQTCTQSSGGDGALAPIDAATPDKFDNYYYQNLMSKQGLFHSDQELFNGGSQDALVKKYRGNAGMFATDFAKAMGRMGSIMPSADTPTEIRLDCKKVN